MNEQIDQPLLEITEFLDLLRTTGQRIVPDSLIWLPHPTKPGRMLAAVIIENPGPSYRSDVPDGGERIGV